jgi:hypothetical protein
MRADAQQRAIEPLDRILERQPCRASKSREAAL